MLISKEKLLFYLHVRLNVGCKMRCQQKLLVFFFFLKFFISMCHLLVIAFEYAIELFDYIPKRDITTTLMV